jgi:hypothetical protein
MSSSSFDMKFTRKFYIIFLESNSEFLIHTSSDSMFIESAEDLSVFPFECEGQTLSVEFFLYFEGIFETFTGFILGTFLIGCYFFQSICRDLSSESLRYEHIPCFR